MDRIDLEFIVESKKRTIHSFSTHCISLRAQNNKNIPETQSYDFVMHINRMVRDVHHRFANACVDPHRMRWCTQRRMLIARNVC